MTASSLAAQTATPAPPPSTPPASIVQVEKPEFLALVDQDVKLEKLADGFRFTEGTTWNPVTHTLTFSDIPASRLYRYDLRHAPGVAPVVWREPTDHANGNANDADGNLYSCVHGTRSVVRIRLDGATETLADHFDGKLLNSPNDIVVKRDGTVWFTDPTYGLEKRPKEQDANHVFCYDPKTHELHAVISDFDEPNGLCFSPDESRLYVANSGKAHDVYVYDVGRDNTLSNPRIFCVIAPGVPDGMRCDREGNLWSTAGDGLHVFNPAGERLGKILFPAIPANLCFGGPTGQTLYVAVRRELYGLQTKTGAPPMR